MLAPLLLALAFLFGVPHDSSRTSERADPESRVSASKAGPQADDCYADTHEALGDLEPDYTSKVACTEPHTWEIVATVSIPEEVLDNSSSESSRKRHDELATYGDHLTPLQKKFDTVVLPECAKARSELTGLADLPSGEVERIGAPLFGHAVSWVNVMPTDLWVAGRTEAICSMRFQNPDGEPRSVRSPSRRPLVAEWMTSSFPAAERLCSDNDLEPTPCEETHMYEHLWALNAAAFLDVPPSTGLTQKQEDRVSLMCNLAYEGATGHLPKTDAVLAVQMPNDGDGWRTCILRNRPNGKNLPMKPGFVAFAP